MKRSIGIRDSELLRLKKYVEGMGVTVKINNNKVLSKTAATWNPEGPEIELFPPKRASKTDINIYFIHEIGHHLDYIHNDNRKITDRLMNALMLENSNKPLSRYQRKLILESELNGMKWWALIYKETHMKFPKYKLWHSREFDTWWYNFFYQIGRYPSTIETRSKYRELKLLFNKHMNIEEYEKLHQL